MIKRRILMTGCSSGVGASLRDVLLTQGHDVVGVGLHGPNISWDFGDLSPGSMDKWAMALFVEHGPFDTLINNAGMTHIDFIHDHTTEDFETVLSVNLVAPYCLSRCFVRSWGKEHVADKGFFGKIINTGSMATKISMRGSPGYCASKAGLEALTKQMAKELAGQLPIGVYCVAPGTIENTVMSEQVIKEMVRTRGMTEDEARKYAMQSPMGRASTHAEVCMLYSYVVNQATIYESGNIYYMPGGMGV